MSFDAKVIQIMIASPGDVEAERLAFREVLSEWNSLNASSMKTVLLPLTWELDVAPELGKHPQDIINNRIVENADVLVAVFWTRIGTQTKRAKGGAVEEVQLQLKREKPVLLYFSDTPMVPSKIDKEQFSQLSKFKRWANTNGLCHSYLDPSDFAKRLLTHLHFTLLNYKLLGSLEVNSREELRAPLGNLKPFSRKLLTALGASRDGRAVVKKSGGSFSIDVDGSPAFVSENEGEYQSWIEEMVSLLGRNFLRDTTSRGEVFCLTPAGKTISSS